MTKLLFLGVLLCLLGCKRDYTCHCTVVHNASTSDYYYNITDKSRRGAKAECLLYRNTSILATGDSTVLADAEVKCDIE